jgi:hypothetical protein
LTAFAAELRSSSGSPLVLAELLGRGGEARVFAVKGDPPRALKLYGEPSAERTRKLKAMLAKVPSDPDRRAGHVSIAWPEALALDSSGQAVGFLMPRIDPRRYLPLHQLYHPRSRRSRAPGMSWRYLVRIARNLSGAIKALHEAGYVVGDLNESNILVDDRALVTLVDLDSIQVSSGTRVFRCTVGKGEYTPPELQGRSFRDTTRRASSDRFGLAVLTFLLLMEGNHPFGGVYLRDGEPPGLEENIAARRSAYFGRSALRPPPAAPPLDILGPEVAALLKRALLAPAWRRPDARAFQEALERLEADLETCPNEDRHAYRSALADCPWCARAGLLGYDAYSTSPSANGRAGSLAAEVAVGERRGGAAAPAATRRQPTGPSGFRGSWPQFHRRLPLVSAVLLALLAAPAVLWQAELRALIAGLQLAEGSRSALMLGAALLPPLTVAAALYLRARRSVGFARGLFVAERVLRAALAASLLALTVSLVAGLALGRGSVLTGDWLLLPTIWVVAFAALLRLVGPGRA